MSQITEQKQNIEDIESAMYITGALRDISAIELKKLRKKFDKNNSFYVELLELFQLVWLISSKNNLKKKTDNKKNLFVAYTTNSHFYGSVNYDIMTKFIKETDSKSSCLIIGETGKQIWTAQPKKRKEVKFLMFDDEMPNDIETNNFLNEINEYNHVYVYYPGFTTVFHQDVEVLDITYKPSKETLIKNKFKDLPKYLFEPDLSEMVDFFNIQVRHVLFDRLLLETQISRVAARLVKMDTADQSARKLIKTEMRNLSRIRTSFSSRRMLETVVGYIQWHKRQIQLVGQ